MDAARTVPSSIFSSESRSMKPSRSTLAPPFTPGDSPALLRQLPAGQPSLLRAAGRRLGATARRGVHPAVPYRLTAWAARLLYHEQLAAMRLTHSAEIGPGRFIGVEYDWSDRLSRGRMAVWDFAPPAMPEPDSIGEFVTQRHWGYGADSTAPPWNTGYPGQRGRSPAPGNRHWKTLAPRFSGKNSFWLSAAIRCALYTL